MKCHIWNLGKYVKTEYAVKYYTFGLKNYFQGFSVCKQLFDEGALDMKG